MKYIITTIKNLEDLSLKELKLKGKIPYQGKLLIETKNIEKIIYNSRSIIRVTEVKSSFKFKKIEDILKKIKETKWKIQEPYRIKCFMEGSHNFNSQDITDKAHKLLNKKTDFKNPKTIISVEIINDNCYLGSLIANDLNKRFYKIKTHKADLNSCLALLSLILAEYKPKQTLLDPYCGCGTILIEAALLARNTTPMHLKNPNKKLDSIKNIKPKVIGFEPLFYNIKNTRINAKIAKVDKYLDLHSCTLDWLETKLKPNSINLIVTHLLRKNEAEFFSNIKNILSKKAIILIITTNKEFNLNEKEYKLIEKRTALVGETLYYLIKCCLSKT